MLQIEWGSHEIISIFARILNVLQLWKDMVMVYAIPLNALYRIEFTKIVIWFLCNVACFINSLIQQVK